MSKGSVAISQIKAKVKAMDVEEQTITLRVNKLEPLLLLREYLGEDVSLGLTRKKK